MGILRPGDREPEVREIANDAKLTHRLFAGAPCQVIAPGLTPRRPAQRIKTDQRDEGEWSCFSSPPGI